MTQLKLRAEDMEFAHIEYACDAGLVATEPDDFVQTWTGKAYIDDGEFDLDLARVEFNIVRCDDDEFLPLDVFDAHSQHCFDLYQALPDLCSDMMSFGILLLHTVIINPEARGLGLGHLIAKHAIQTFGINCELIVCKPYPLTRENDSTSDKVTDLWLPREEEVDFDSAQEKLRKHWSELGFRRMAETDYFRL